MTIKDIARRANVSISTVSRSLNDSSLVADETKQRVLQIAREVGFEFNASARGLITSQVGTIGIILPDDYDQFHIHLYHSALHNNLRRTLEREDLDLIVAFSRNRFSGMNNIQKLVRRKKVDGLIMVMPFLDADTENFLREREVPYVFSHYPPAPDHRNVDWVYVDHEKGGTLIGQLFARKEYGKVVTFRCSNGMLEFEQRVEGFKFGFSRNARDAELREIEGFPSYENGFDLALSEEIGLHRADAIFALNDLMALGIIQGLHSRGYEVPRDVAVVGYDDTPLASSFHPRLTTVRQPAEDVAFLTCERLIEVINDRQDKRVHVPRHIALQPHLVIRDTCF